MDHLSATSLRQISGEALAAAAVAACTALHLQQCKIVDDRNIPAAAKIAAVLRIQKLIKMNELSMWRAIRQLEGTDTAQ